MSFMVLLMSILLVSIFEVLLLLRAMVSVRMLLLLIVFGRMLLVLTIFMRMFTSRRVSFMPMFPVAVSVVPAIFERTLLILPVLVSPGAMDRLSLTFVILETDSCEVLAHPYVHALKAVHELLHASITETVLSAFLSTVWPAVRLMVTTISGLLVKIACSHSAIVASSRVRSRKIGWFLVEAAIPEYSG